MNRPTVFLDGLNVIRTSCKPQFVSFCVMTTGVRKHNGNSGGYSVKLDAEPGWLTKSKFLYGNQCHKWLWCLWHRPELFAQEVQGNQMLYDEGRRLGQLARLLYPNGIEAVSDDNSVEQRLRKTRELLKQRRPLFEAAFASNGVYAQADVLNPVAHDSWDVIEVKSATGVKAEYLLDLAFQVHVYNGAGLEIRRCWILHVNPEYVREGEIEPEKLFKRVDVTHEVADTSREIESRLDEMFAIIRQKKCPELEIGPHCLSPYSCPLQDLCWDFLPRHNVLTLYGGRKKGWELLNDGVLSLDEIPANYPLTQRQKIQCDAVRKGRPHINRKAVSQFLQQLEYPVYYMDFETFATAIPMFDGMRPYQMTPFQFSVDRVDRPGARPVHFGFLAEGRSDPRPEFLENLNACLGPSGSVVAYNAKFEEGVLSDLANAFPRHAGWVEKIKARMLDLLRPFRGFDYYHPEQLGSASLKSVLPALTGHSYESLDIKDGNQASYEYVRTHFCDVPEAEREQVRRHLEAYCGQDTGGMVAIVNALRELCP